MHKNVRVRQSGNRIQWFVDVKPNEKSDDWKIEKVFYDELSATKYAGLKIAKG